MAPTAAIPMGEPYCSCPWLTAAIPMGKPYCSCPWLTAAIPMGKPSCSCTLTRARPQAASVLSASAVEVILAEEVAIGVGETVILLHPPSPFSRCVSIVMERGCQYNDSALADVLGCDGGVRRGGEAGPLHPDPP